MAWSSCGFRLLKRSIMSPAVFLKHLGGKVAKALRLERRSSRGVSSSGRSRPSVAPIDAHRAEAIEDCIEFINSASFCINGETNFIDSMDKQIVTIRPGNQYYGREAKKFDMVRVFMHSPGGIAEPIDSLSFCITRKRRFSAERAAGDWNAEFDWAKANLRTHSLNR